MKQVSDLRFTAATRNRNLGADRHLPRALPRTSDHYVRQALRCIDNPQRLTSYVDYCDKWLYFYRADRDPQNGTGQRADRRLQISERRAPHWAFVMNGPAAIPYEINEIPETKRWKDTPRRSSAAGSLWKQLGKTDRRVAHRNARDASTAKAAGNRPKTPPTFICWLLDYTGRDVVYSEGEFTGWAAKFSKISQIPKKHGYRNRPAENPG